MDRAIRSRNATLVCKLALMAAGSFAFGFALVPLYDVICDAAGIRVNATPAPAVESDAGAARRVTLELVSVLPAGAEWALEPVAGSVVVRPGRLHEARFRIHSLAGRPVTGQAIPSVAPAYAARYLRKTECFCFTPQHFAANEQREFVVRFIIDPDLPSQIERMTLAYSMYTLPGEDPGKG